MKPPISLFAGLVLVCAICLSSAAWAKPRQPSTPSLRKGSPPAVKDAPATGTSKAKASALYREANLLSKKGTGMTAEAKQFCQEALAKYREAYGLFPSYKIELNIGGILDVLGYSSRSASYFEKFLLNSAKAPPNIISAARSRLDQLRGKLASIKVAEAVKGAAILVNGQVVGKAPMQLPHYVEPGSYILTVQHPSFLPRTRNLTLKKGEHLVPKVSLISQVEANQARLLLRKAEKLRHRKTIWGYSALATGAALALGAGVLYGVGGAQGNEAHDGFNETDSIVAQERYAIEVESSKKLLIGGHVLIGMAAVALGVSIYQLATRPEERPEEDPPEGSEEEVREAVRETIRTAAPGGGYIISSSNSIHPGVKPENYIAMIKAAREFGRYPIVA